MNNLETSKFLNDWKEKYERKVFIMEDENDQKSLIEAVELIKKYVLNVAKGASLISVVEQDRFKDLYIRVFYD